MVFNATWMPVRRFKLSAMAHIWYWKYHQQYVSSTSGNTTTEYVVGNIDRQTTTFTLRAELYITPELSIQYYGSPYYSVGDYDSFRRVDQSHARNINERLEELDVSYDQEQNTYSYQNDGEMFQFYNPDFSFMQFRSNLVFRWEYKLGSTIYAVWSHDRTNWEGVYNPIGDITGDLFDVRGNHVFMVKLNYWFSI